MKKRMRTLLLTSLLILFSIPGSVFAAKKIPLELAEYTLWAKDNGTMAWCENVNIDYEKFRITSIKSSSPKVIKPYKENNEYNLSCIKPLKPGKSKITITYKYKGKKYSSSAVYTVKKNPNPIKAIYVNGKKVKLKKNTYSHLISEYKKSKAKVKVVLKKGWVMEECSAYSEDDNYIFKNGGSLKIAKNNHISFYYRFRNKEYDNFEYTLTIKR